MHPRAKFYEGDIRDRAVLGQIFRENPIEAVVHFAANSLVAESVEKPLLYFNNNVYGMQVLLEAMATHAVKRIVFSSSAAVYGEPKHVPIQEDDEAVPTNPYGETKRMMERMIRWVDHAHGNAISPCATLTRRERWKTVLWARIITPKRTCCR